MSILIFLGVLFVLVLVHELGHFAVAKWFGMRVDEFGIGFPPKLFGIRHGETEYTLNLVPLGGFVKIQGEDAVVTHNDNGDDRSFTHKSRFAQSMVLIAGVTMNILFAWFLFAIAYGVGVQSVVEESKATPSARLMVTNVLPGSPASIASFPARGEVSQVVVEDKEISPLTPSAVSDHIKNSNGASIAFSIISNNETKTYQVTPMQNVISGEPDRYALGVSFGLVDTVSYPPHRAVYEGGKATIGGLVAITAGISKLVLDAVTLKADLSDVAGPVGIAGLAHEATQIGFTTLLLFTAFISLNLAVINILPFPALDGGRLLIVILEGVLRRQFNTRYISTLNTVGFALLILLMVVVTGNDIARLI